MSRPEICKHISGRDKFWIKTKEATQGAVKGVILSPIDLLREAGNEIKGRVVSEEQCLLSVVLLVI